MKEKNNSLLMYLVIILFLICLVMGSYIFIKEFNKNDIMISEKNNENFQNNNSQNIVETTDNLNVQSKENIIIFDESKSINSDEKDYELSCQGNAGIWVTVNENQELIFSFTPKRVVEYYSLDWKSDREDMIKNIIRFDKKIADIFFGTMGQDSSNDTLFILLEDGTVEYIPIVHMFNNVQESPISYGKINDVSDITKFVLASTQNGVTTLAIKSDGSFYDMWYELKDTGNY